MYLLRLVLLLLVWKSKTGVSRIIYRVWRNVSCVTSAKKLPPSSIHVICMMIALHYLRVFSWKKFFCKCCKNSSPLYGEGHFAVLNSKNIYLSMSIKRAKSILTNLPIAKPFRVHWTTPCRFPTWHLSKIASPSFTVWFLGSSIKYWLLKLRYWAFNNSEKENVRS